LQFCLSQGLTLQAIRFNGINQQQFIVTDPTILDAIVFTPTGVSSVPTVSQLASFAQLQTTRIVSPVLQSPYTIQTALSVERQLPFKTTLSATFINAQTRRHLRSRNVNAPVGGARPIPTAGNVFQYESTGRFNQNQLILNFRSNFIDGVSIFGNYSFGGSISALGAFLQPFGQSLRINEFNTEFLVRSGQICLRQQQHKRTQCSMRFTRKFPPNKLLG